jgi:hypothetical protein
MEKEEEKIVETIKKGIVEKGYKLCAKFAEIGIIIL